MVITGCFSSEVSPSTFSHHSLTIPPFCQGSGGVLRGKDQEQGIRMTMSATCLLFRAIERFQSERKMKKKPQNSTFPISSELDCLSLCSCYDNRSSPPSSFGSVSKLRTVNVKDQKMGKASRHSKH